MNTHCSELAANAKWLFLTRSHLSPNVIHRHHCPNLRRFDSFPEMLNFLQPRSKIAFDSIAVEVCRMSWRGSRIFVPAYGYRTSGESAAPEFGHGIEAGSVPWLGSARRIFRAIFPTAYTLN